MPNHASTQDYSNHYRDSLHPDPVQHLYDALQAAHTAADGGTNFAAGAAYHHIADALLLLTGTDPRPVE